MIEGDWICKVCAKDARMNVGKEGYEWAVQVGGKRKYFVVFDSNDKSCYSEFLIYEFCISSLSGMTLLSYSQILLKI